MVNAKRAVKVLEVIPFRQDVGKQEKPRWYRRPLVLGASGLGVTLVGLGLVIAAYVGRVQVNSAMAVCGLIVLVIGVDLVVAAILVAVFSAMGSATSRTRDLLWRRYMRKRNLGS